MENTHSSEDHNAPRAKRAHTKSRNGCKNCKARKVKCDETRPLCNNCSRHYTNITECEWSETPIKPNARQSPPFPDKPPMPPLGPPSETDDWAGDRTKIFEALKIDESAARVVDPFNSLPPNEVASVDHLIRHYIVSEPSTSFPFFQSSSIMKAWWPFAKDDIVLFHVILVLSDRKLRRLDKVKDSEKMQKMMTITMALLEERLKDPVLGIKDETIATVSHLAAIEHERGDNRALKRHVKELRRLITVRGGLDCFKASCPLMASFTAWVGLLTAEDPFLVPPELKFDDSQTLDPRLFVNAEPLRFDLNSVGVSLNLCKALGEVDGLAQKFNMVISEKATPQETGGVIFAITVTVQRCLGLADQYETKNSRDALSSALALAGAMQLIAPVGGAYPDSSNTLNALMHRLKVNASVLIDADILPHPLLFWLLYIGGVTSLFPPDRDYFVRHLAALAQDMGIREWARAREICQFVMIHTVFCESVFARLWFDIEEKMQQLEFFRKRMKLTHDAGFN